MQIIVPLAGPDFEFEDGGVKAELLIDGRPLLRRALESRAWWRGDGEDALTFVLRDSDISRRFADSRLSQWYPHARCIYLSDFAQGAAFSAAAGLSLVGHEDDVVCVDLVDILYDARFDPAACFASSDIGGAALVFDSSEPQYSYLREDQSGRVVEAAEKRVISSKASVGTYFFASPTVYFDAVSHMLRHRETLAHNGLFYVCPLMNGVIASGRSVALQMATNVVDIKLA